MIYIIFKSYKHIILFENLQTSPQFQMSTLCLLMYCAMSYLVLRPRLMKTSVLNENASPTIKKSPLDFLANIFQNRKDRNPSYSMRAFARDLGVSTSLLSRVFSGTRPLSLKLALQISTAIDLQESETNALVLSVLESSAKSSKISKKLRTNLEKKLATANAVQSNPFYTTVDIEQFRAMASWYHLAILNLTAVEGFQSEPQWIAEQLGISSIEARSAIERLISIGLLVEIGSDLKRTKKSFYFKTQKSHLAIRKFHHEMIGKAQVTLDKTTDHQFQRRLINGITFTCASEHIELIKEKIDRLQDEILALTEKGKKEEVYQINVQFFPLTEIKKGDSK